MGAGGGKTQTGQHCTENSLAPVLAKVRLHRTSTCLYRDAVFPSLSQMPASVPCVQATPSSPPFLQLSLGTRAGPGFSLLQGQLGFGDRDKQEVTPPPFYPTAPPPIPWLSMQRDPGTLRQRPTLTSGKGRGPAEGNMIQRERVSQTEDILGRDLGEQGGAGSDREGQDRRAGPGNAQDETRGTAGGPG